MRDHYRDRDHSRSRSRERDRDRRDNPHRMPPRDNYRNSIKLHVRNLPLTASEDYVQSEFERFGRVEDVKIMRKNANGQPLREFLYGFIQMGSEDEARHALDMINNNPNLGWQVSYSKEKPRGGPGGDYHQRSPERSHRPYDRQNDRQHDRPYDRQHDRNDRPYDRQHDRPYDRQHDRQYDHYRKDSGDDRYHNRDRRDRSPRRHDYDRRRNSQSPDERRFHDNNAPPQQFQGNALMSLLQNNPNNNNPNMANNLMQILQLPPEQLSQLTATMEKSQISGNPILVRELWVGNLPDNLNDKKLKNTVEMFGDIENIENFNKPNGTFAFVKFRKVSQASKAIEGVQNLKLLLDSPNLKVSFSDHQRRRNIVGDNIDYEKDEELVPIIYIGYTSGTFIPPEGAIREVFSAYGDIINVIIKQVPKDNSAKPYALVEMATLEQAKQARSRIFLQDERGEKRTRLGDRKCELNILIKAKAKDPSNAPQGGPHGQHRNPMQHQHQQQQYPYQQQNPPYQPRSQGNFGNTGYNDPNSRQRNYYPGGNTGAGNYQGGQRPYNQGGSQQPPLQNPNQASPPRVHNLLSGTGQNPPPQIPSGMGQGAQPNRYGSNPMIPTAPNAPQSTFSPNAGQNRQFANLGSQGGSQNPSQYPYANPPVQGNPPYNPNMPYNPTAVNPPATNSYPNAPYNPASVSAGPNYGGNMSTPLSSVEKKGDDNKKNTHMELLDTLQSLFSHPTKSEPSSASKQEEKKKEEAPPIVIDNEDDDDANRETIWSGFITKNKQNRVGVDAILIEGDDTILKDYFNLNVGHRTLYEEVIKRQPKTVVLFVPANETQYTLFNDYMKYFKEKQRAGVVTLKKNTLYVLPPCEEAFKIHKFKENELLGVFVDLTDIPKETIV